MAIANCAIQQAPLWNFFTAGEDIIFVISNNDAVANELKVKFIAEVHIGTTQINPSSTDDIIGTFKTTPNNAGVGMFNLGNIIDNYVKADNTASSFAKYKGASASAAPFPIHIIDKFSKNKNTLKFLAIQFKVEYLDQDTNSITFGQLITGGAKNTTSYKFFNGYLKYTDELQIGGVSVNDFGYTKIQDFYLSGGTGRFLTNAPTTQYANSGDYGTLGFAIPDAGMALNAKSVKIYFYNDAGVAHSTNYEYTLLDGTGAYTTWSDDASKHIIYVGAYPGNVEQISGTWATLIAWGMTHYKVYVANSSGTPMSETITIHLNCPNTQGYESIRLCWLNQWGTWDYYTFTQKSVVNFTTQGSTYTQLGGTWNESSYDIASYKGGKKSFRRNATEKIKINTDFVIENYNVMFEELINSPEVYLLTGLQTDTYEALNQYVTPVRILSSNFTKKTKANDQLIQYTFEIEKSKILRTQSV